MTFPIRLTGLAKRAACLPGRNGMRPASPGPGVRATARCTNEAPNEKGRTREGTSHRFLALGVFSARCAAYQPPRP
jgi:hypothetical protein